MKHAWKELVDEYEKILNFRLREEKVAYIVAVIISVIISAFMEYIFILTNLMVFAIATPVIMFLYFLWMVYYTVLYSIILLEMGIEWLHGDDFEY